MNRSLKFLGALVFYSLFVQGCASHKGVDHTQSPQSNLVTHDYYEYHGVKVEPSHNWYMGNRKGFEGNEKIRFGDNGAGFYFKNATAIGEDRSTLSKQHQSNVDAESARKEDNLISEGTIGSEITMSDKEQNGFVCSNESNREDGKVLLNEWIVHFNTNGSYPIDFEKIKTDLARVNPSFFEVSGHTDDMGSDTYNDWLSKKRAKVVEERLFKIWANSKSDVKWSGECPRLVLNVDDESRAKNRRVHIRAYKD